jgi:hypothetical protein
VLCRHTFLYLLAVPGYAVSDHISQHFNKLGNLCQILKDFPHVFFRRGEGNIFLFAGSEGISGFCLAL